MATKLYLNQAAPAVSPTYSSSWNVAPAYTRRAASPTKDNTATASGTITMNSTGGTVYMGFTQWVYGPVGKQTLTGTLTGQMMCDESNAAANSTLAVTVTVMYYDTSWHVRGTPVALQAPLYSAGTPPEFAVGSTLTNRQIRNSSNAVGIALSPVNILDGDYICIEMGIAKNCTTTSYTATMAIQATTAGSDLPADDTTTTANNPWFNFSNTIVTKTLSPTAAIVCQSAVSVGNASDPLVNKVFQGDSTITCTSAVSVGNASDPLAKKVFQGDSQIVSSSTVTGSLTKTTVGTAPFAGVSPIVGQSAVTGVKLSDKYNFATVSPIVCTSVVSDVKFSDKYNFTGVSPIVGQSVVTGVKFSDKYNFATVSPIVCTSVVSDVKFSDKYNFTGVSPIVGQSVVSDVKFSDAYKFTSVSQIIGSSVYQLNQHLIH